MVSHEVKEGIVMLVAPGIIERVFQSMHGKLKSPKRQRSYDIRNSDNFEKDRVLLKEHLWLILDSKPD